MILHKIIYLCLVLVITICFVSTLETTSGQHHPHRREQLNQSRQLQQQQPRQHLSHHNSQQCKKHCPVKQRWICGFNGTHYRFFANKCWMDKYNCGKKNEYNHIDRKQCQKAHQEHHKLMVSVNHGKLEGHKFDSKCIKCNAAYKPVCGYNGDVNQMFKNMCHFKRFNCIHTEKKFQTTQLNNCPIPVSNKNQETRKEDKKDENVLDIQKTPEIEKQ